MSRALLALRIFVAMVFTPIIAAFGAGLGAALVYAIDKQNVDGAGTGVLAIAFLGLFVAPFSWLYAIIVQIPLAIVRRIAGKPEFWGFQAISLAAGIALFYLVFGILIPADNGVIPHPDWSAIYDGDKGDPVQEKIVLLGFGAAGGIATGLFWWLLVSWKPRLGDDNA